ncbi:MAG: hypothetical protein KIT14_23415 [bacterium]|nr:hypothetical protein [bacterium]
MHPANPCPSRARRPRAAIASLLVLAALVRPATAATVVDLGAFIPIGINAHGGVVGDVVGRDDDDAPGHAAMWANGTLTPLPERPGTQLSDALAIGDGGRIVGLEYVDGNNVHAVYWDGATTPVQIGPPSTGFDFSQATDVDAAGNVVGGTSLDDGPPHYLGFYRPAGGGPLVLVGAGNLPPGAGSARVGAISGDGTTMLGEITGAGAADGYYLWSTAAPAAAGVKLDLTPDRSPFALFGGSVYSPLLVQNTLARDGAVFGYKGSGQSRTWFLRTKDGTQTPIVGLTAHNAINAKHVVVGTIATGNALDPVRAGMWDPTTKTVTDLNTLLPAGSGWTLYVATAISDTGDVVGIGGHDERQAGFLLRAPALTARAEATPSRAKVAPDDVNAVITVTVTLANSTAQALAGVGPAGAPTVSGTGAVDPIDGPVPPALDLGPDQSGTLTWRFKPTKAGTVTFQFPGFANASGAVTNDEGAITTSEVRIVDLGVEVTVTPNPLPNDSTRASFAVLRIKVTDSKGAAIVGQRVRFKVPRYVGPQRDQTPRLLVCDAAGGRVFPPGDSAVLDVVRVAPTDGSGEIVYGLWLGTDRTQPASTQLLVLAEAIDDADALLGDGSAFVTLGSPAIGSPPGPTLGLALDQRQTEELPASQRTSTQGVTGRGTPAKVVQSLVRWLESKREQGLADLQNVDWAPITTQDGSQAAVVFFARGDGRRMGDYLAGTTPDAPAGAVLPIEVAPLGTGSHEVYWGSNLVPLAQWETTRPLAVTRNENPTLPVRGRPVAATSLVTSDASAFFGYPYPTVSPTGPYSGSCLPAMHGVGVDVHSPITLLVRDAQGAGVGFDAAGVYVNDAEGAAYSAGEPSQWLLSPGSYTTDVTGTGAGPATIVMTSTSGGAVGAKTITLRAKPGRTGTLTFDDGLAKPTGTFARRKLKAKDGVPIEITGTKKRVKLRRGDALTLAVQDVFGLPVQGARVRATGKGFDASTITATDGTAALPLLLAKSTKLTLEVSGPGLRTKKQKVAVKLAKP